MLSSILCDIMLRKTGATETILIARYGIAARYSLAHLQYLGLAHSWVRTTRFQEVEKFWGARNLQIENPRRISK